MYSVYILKMFRVIIVASSLIFISIFAYEHTLADQCDWSGSGESESGGVRSVYLRCARGTVLWRYPRGALRVVLNFPISSMEDIFTNLNVGFRTCVKISGPARVFLEADRMLRPIYSRSDGKHKHSHRCFRLQTHVAALFMEAENHFSFENTRVELQYDLELNSLKGGPLHVPDEEEECRPCSMEELANAYCRSDLVATGTVTAVEERIDLDAAELVLRVNKILSQVQEAENNEDNTTDSSEDSIRVRVPLVCDARHGPGEFVIMAKRRLGDLILVCAPMLETWEQIVWKMDTAPCVLRS